MKSTLIALVIALGTSACANPLTAPTAVEYVTLDASEHTLLRTVTNGHSDVTWITYVEKAPDAYRGGLLIVQPHFCSNIPRVGRVVGDGQIVEVTQDGADVGVCP